jgi:hypothetical protein
MTSNAPRTGYAPLNGVNMYYEIHGSGLPIVVLHGAFMTIELMGKLIADRVCGIGRFPLTVGLFTMTVTRGSVM